MADIAVSVERAAELIDVSPTTLRAYIDQGLLPAVKLPSASAKHQGEKSRRVHVLVADLERFAEQHRVTEPAR